MLHKTVGAALRDLDLKEGIISGYWSSFDTVDAVKDRVRPGAYTRTIKELGPESKQPRIMYLWQHDSKAVLGKPSELTQDDFGLRFTAQIVPTALGKDVLLLYEYGVITEHSIGYDVIRQTYNRATGITDLDELKLYEGSAVTWGCNADTPVLAVKAAQDPAGAARRIKSLDDLLHKSDIRTETLAAELETELKALKAAMTPAPAQDRPYTILGALDSIERALKTQMAGAQQPAEETAMSGKPRSKTGQSEPAQPVSTTPAAKTVKARTFEEVYTSDREAYDILEDLDDLYEALRESLLSVLIEGSSSDGDNSTAQASLSQFGARVTSWLSEAEVQSCWAEIADEAEEAGARATMYGTSGWYSWMSSRTADERAAKTAKTEPAQPVGRKAGRTISSGNRKTLEDAAAGIKEAASTIMTHHKSINDLLEATKPADKETDDEGDGKDEGKDGKETGKAAPAPSAAKDTLAPDRAVDDGSGTTQSIDPAALSALFADVRAIKAAVSK
jgi:HK97 family phage prohead protease